MSTENPELNSARDRAIVECLRIFAREGRRIRLQRMLEMNASPDQNLALGEVKTSIESEVDVSEQTDDECSP